jgi:hypothetical protein
LSLLKISFAKSLANKFLHAIINVKAIVLIVYNKIYMLNANKNAKIIYSVATNVKEYVEILVYNVILKSI